MCAGVRIGRYCTEDVDECLAADVCKNGGTCHNEYGRYYCVCVNGWTDLDCGVNIDDCESQPCYNGATCRDGVAKFECDCPRGKTGNSFNYYTGFIGPILGGHSGPLCHALSLLFSPLGKVARRAIYFTDVFSVFFF